MTIHKPVSSNPKVHLGGTGVPLKGLTHAKNSVRGSHLHSSPERGVP